MNGQTSNIYNPIKYVLLFSLLWILQKYLINSCYYHFDYSKIDWEKKVFEKDEASLKFRLEAVHVKRPTKQRTKITLWLLEKKKNKKNKAEIEYLLLTYEILTFT